MRIVHVGSLIPEETTPGGGGNYPFCLAAAEADLGHVVELWGGAARGASFHRKKVGSLTVCYDRVMAIRPFHRSDPLFLRLLARMAFGPKADIVHLHQYKVIQWRWLIPLAKLRGMKVCLTDLGGGGWRNLPVWVGDRVDRFLLLSHYNVPFFVRGHEEKFRTNHGLWATDHNYPGTPERCVVVGGGVDIQFYVPRPAPPDSPPYVLYVGRAMPHKGLEIAIRALAHLAERHPTLMFRLVGPQDNTKYLEFLRQESVRLKVEDRVVFLGYRAPEGLLHLYQGASVFVLPSTYRPSDGRLLHKPELFGLVLLEAMACKVPVICSRVAGLIESVHEGETGLTFEDQDAAGLAACIDRLLTDSDLRSRLVETAYRMVQAEYTWRRVAERCLTVYEDLLSH